MCSDISRFQECLQCQMGLKGAAAVILQECMMLCCEAAAGCIGARHLVPTHSAYENWVCSRSLGTKTPLLWMTFKQCLFKQSFCRK
jgi:hypothetical protein